MPAHPLPISDTTLYRHAAELVVRKVGDEAILVPVRNRVGDLESIFTLNDTALRVWNLLDGRTPLSAIAETIAGEYDVTLETARQDVVELAATLHEAGLIETAGEPG